MSQDLLKLFEARTYRGQDDERLNYRLLAPRGYDPARRWPLILFMHGAGERGGNNKVQVKHFGPVIASEEMLRDYPCFVVAPQVPDGSSWAFLQRTGNHITASIAPAPPLRMAVEAIAELEREFSIDPQRIYVTGLSMGGFGTWDALWRWPGRFAAAVPICGGGDPTKVRDFLHTPLWAFHGDQDYIVPVEATRVMIEALRAAGGAPRYTEYSGVGHDSWTPAYHEDGLFAWLFTQHLP